MESSEGEPWHLLYQAMALSNDATGNDQGEVIGDPTEVALYRAAREADHDKEVLILTSPRLGEIPFDSTRKRMTTFHHGQEGSCHSPRGHQKRWWTNATLA